MGYNFLNPNEAEEYRRKATAGGLSIEKANDYIYKQAKQQSALTELRSPSKDLTAKQEEQKIASNTALNTMSLMEEIYTRGGESLGTGRDIASRASIGLGQVGELIGVKSEKTARSREFESMAQMLVGQLSQAFGSGTPQEGESKRLIASMPNRLTAPEEANSWFKNVRHLLSYGAGKQQEEVGLDQIGQPQMMQPELPPTLNAFGEKAEIGDLVLDNMTGQMMVYGKTEDILNKASTWKKSSDGEDLVDNKLIKFLADKELLPILGGITGSLVPGANMITGAIGSMAGKGLQQALKELTDPDQQNISDMGRAIIVEGVTDAMFSGLLMGVGKGAKLILGQIAPEGIEQATKGVIKETFESGTKKLGSTYGDDLLKRLQDTKDLTKAKKMLKSAETRQYARLMKRAGKSAEFHSKFGVYPSDIMGAFDNPTKIADVLSSVKAGRVASSKNLANLLDKKYLKSNDVIDDIYKYIDELKGDGKKFTPAVENSINALQQQVEYIQKETIGGGNIPAQIIQDVKREIGKIAYNASSEIKLNKEVFDTAYKALNNKMKKEFGDKYVSANIQSAFYKFAEDSIGPEVVKLKTKSQLKHAVHIYDGIAYMANPLIFLTKKSVDFMNMFSPSTKAKFFKNASNMISQRSMKPGSKKTMRALLMLATKVGTPITVADNLLYQGVRKQNDIQGLFKGEDEQSNSIGSPSSAIPSQVPGMENRFEPSTQELQSQPFLAK